MKIATWNVNGLRARLDFVMHWLKSRSPDLVGLQELKLTDEQFPHDAFESCGYTALTHGQKAWNGVAILSREKASVVQRGLPGQDEFGARLLTATVGELSFTTLYCPNGKTVEHEDYPRKLDWYDSLVRHLSEGRPDIVCGDFNICPGPLDSWDEARFRDGIFHTEAERARFQALLDLGYADAFRQVHPDRVAFSWWDYRGGAFHKKQGLRIDTLLVQPGITSRIEGIEIDRDYRKKQDGLTPSDHAPVVLELA